MIQRLLPFISYQNSVIRRGGIVGAVRNMCFQVTEHEWLLGEEVGLATQLLLPLAGPEELDEDDMEGMPDDLQVCLFLTNFFRANRRPVYSPLFCFFSYYLLVACGD